MSTHMALVTDYHKANYTSASTKIIPMFCFCKFCKIFILFLNKLIGCDET